MRKIINENNNINKMEVNHFEKERIAYLQEEQMKQIFKGFKEVEEGKVKPVSRECKINRIS